MVFGKSNINVLKRNILLKSIIINIIRPFVLLGLVFTILIIISETYYGFFFLAIMVGALVINIMLDYQFERIIVDASNLHNIVVRVLKDDEVVSLKGNEVQEGDTVLLRYQDIVLFDSILIEGSLIVDESHITGSTSLGLKEAGDIIYKNSYICNGEAKAKINESNYIDTVIKNHKSVKKHKSKFDKLFDNIFIISSVFAGFYYLFAVLINVFNNNIVDFDSFKEVSKSLLSAVILMVPFGLSILKAIASLIFTKRIDKTCLKITSRKNLDIFDDIDTVCLDKTGLLTNKSPALKTIVSISGEKESYIKSIIYRVLTATQDNDPTAIALLSVCTSINNDPATAIISFNGDNKFSGATFSDGTFVLGEAEFLNLVGKSRIIRMCNEYTSMGLHVIVVAKTFDKIINNQLKGQLEPLALIVLEEQIRENSRELVEFFHNKGLDIRILSSDDVFHVSQIAKTFKIEHSEDTISLEGKSKEEILELCSTHSLFARCDIEQKAIIVEGLQSLGKKVLYLGDAENDILALNKADYGVTLFSSHDDVKRASKALINDNAIDSYRELDEEGSSYQANFEKILSLYLIKSSLGFLLALFFLVISLGNNNPGLLFPLSIDNLFVLEVIVMFGGSLLLLFNKKAKNINSNSFDNIFHVSFPAIIIGLISVVGVYAYHLILASRGVYSGIDNIASLNGIVAIYLTAYLLVVGLKLAMLYAKTKLAPFLVTFLVSLGVFIILFFAKTSNILGFDFTKITGVYWLVCGIMVFVSTVLLFVITGLLETFFGGYDEEK